MIHSSLSYFARKSRSAVGSQLVGNCVPNRVSSSKRNGQVFVSPRRFMATQQTKGNWKQNGTPEIIIGATIVTIVGVDYYFQKRQKIARQEIMFDLKSAIRQDDAEESRIEEGGGYDSTNAKEDKLFECIVRRMPKYFDGRKSLMGVAVGDRVSILEERVGPDGMYHMCRLEERKTIVKGNAKISVGWFPISCLEKIRS